MKISQTLLQALSLAVIAGSCGIDRNGQEAARQRQPETRAKTIRKADTVHRIDSLAPSRPRSCDKQYCPACGMG